MVGRELEVLDTGWFMTSHNEIKLKSVDEIKKEKDFNRLSKNIKAVFIDDKVILFKLFLGRWMQLSPKEEEATWHLIHQS